MSRINKLSSLWKDFKEEDVSLQRTRNSDILLVDGLNTYIRAFSATSSMNEDGIHVGGIAGFLISVGYAIKLLKPSRVIIVFDGPGGSMTRKKIFSGYKGNRHSKVRFNRAFESDRSETESYEKQLLRLARYLKILPVNCLAQAHVEADDVIAYLAVDKYKDNDIHIMSSDRDFYQLVDGRVNVWSPTKKRIYDCDAIHREFGISCKNFLLYRVLSGDKSDNIDGVKGAGLKTVIKCFPFLAEDNEHTIEEILTYSENNKSKYQLYRNVLENVDKIKRNHSLMQLNDSCIRPNTQLKLNEIVDVESPSLNKLQFIKYITEDKLWSNIPNYIPWLNETFGKLIK